MMEILLNIWLAVLALCLLAMGVTVVIGLVAICRDELFGRKRK